MDMYDIEVMLNQIFKTLEEFEQRIKQLEDEQDDLK